MGRALEPAAAPGWWHASRRGARTLGVAGRTGLAVLPHVVRRPADGARAARSVSSGLERLGATYIKLGQLAASAPGLIGEELASGFRGLLDEVGPAPFPAVRAVVEAELGAPLGRLFRTFDAVPLASASMAVVHRAVRPDGTPVAVKVLRPGIEDVVRADLAVLRPLVRELAGLLRTHPTRIAVGLVEGMAEQLGEELDLGAELQAMTAYRDILDRLGETLVTVPEPVPELSATRVLTMELVDGVPIDDLSAVLALGVDPRPLVQALVRTWFGSVLVHGFFHGDVHAGNLLVRPDGRVAVLDFGVTGRLDPVMHGAFRAMVAGALGDDSAWESAARVMMDRLLDPELVEASGLTAADVAQLLAARAGSMFTVPFSQVQLSDLFNAPIPALAEDRPSAGTVVRRLLRRAVGRPAEAVDPITAFDRHMFLLGKQLVYFERYGRLYLDELPLLYDPQPFRDLLAST